MTRGDEAGASAASTLAPVAGAAPLSALKPAIANQAATLLCTISAEAMVLGDALASAGYPHRRWAAPDAVLRELARDLPESTLAALLAGLSHLSNVAGQAWLAGDGTTPTTFPSELAAVTNAIRPLRALSARQRHTPQTHQAARRLERALADPAVGQHLDALARALRALAQLAPVATHPTATPTSSHGPLASSAPPDAVDGANAVAPLASEIPAATPSAAIPAAGETGTAVRTAAQTAATQTSDFEPSPVALVLPAAVRVVPVLDPTASATAPAPPGGVGTGDGLARGPSAEMPAPGLLASAGDSAPAEDGAAEPSESEAVGDTPMSAAVAGAEAPAQPLDEAGGAPVAPTLVDAEPAAPGAADLPAVETAVADAPRAQVEAGRELQPRPQAAEAEALAARLPDLEQTSERKEEPMGLATGRVDAGEPGATVLDGVPGGLAAIAAASDAPPPPTRNVNAPMALPTPTAAAWPPPPLPSAPANERDAGAAPPQRRWADWPPAPPASRVDLVGRRPFAADLLEAPTLPDLPALPLPLPPPDKRAVRWVDGAQQVRAGANSHSVTTAMANHASARGPRGGYAAPGRVPPPARHQHAPPSWPLPGALRRRSRWPGALLAAAALLVVVCSTAALLWALSLASAAPRPANSVAAGGVANATATRPVPTHVPPTAIPAAGPPALAVAPVDLRIPCPSSGNSATLTITNSGGTTLHWRISNPPLLLFFTAYSGSVGPGAQSAIQVRAYARSNTVRALVFASDGGTVTISYTVGGCH